MKRFAAMVMLSAVILLGQELKVGSKVDNFQLKQVDGNPVQFSSLKGDVTVLMFVSVQCPVSNAYNDRMNALYKDYSAKGVKFVAVNANRTEAAADVAEHARNHFQFAVYKDADNVVADRFNAQVTPETYVIDKDGVIRYHGSIDDSQNPSNIKAQRLRSALDAVLEGKSVAQSETKAFGCTIKRVQKT